MSEDTFKNRRAAHDWLVSNGYNVSRGKFYQDCGNGAVVINSDKTISKFQVLQYGVVLNQQVSNPGGKDIVGAAEADLRKKLAEAEIAEGKAVKMRREEDKYWLSAVDGWALVAGLVNGLRGSIRHHVYSARREIVETGSGDQDRADEVYQLIENIVDSAFNEVAGKKINIEFEK